MPYHLREGVFAARSGEQIILLDLPSNRYLGISTKLSQNEGDHDLPSLGRLGGTTVDNLVARGMIVACNDDSAGASTRIHRIPLRHHAAGPGVTASWPIIVLAAVWQMRIQWELRRHGLAFFTRRIERERQSLAAVPPDILAYSDIAAAFEMLNPVFPVANRCLIRSLAFIAVSHRNGLVPALVLGVQFRPFAAHCWVQHGETLLNDRLENVEAFTPILTI